MKRMRTQILIRVLPSLGLSSLEFSHLFPLCSLNETNKQHSVMSEEVAQVLLDIGLGQHVGALIYQEHVIDLEKLKLLDEDKMKDIGMPFEDQRKIRLWIRACETFDIVSNKEGELDLKRLQIAFASLDLGQSETATRAMLREADISESNTC